MENGRRKKWERFLYSLVKIGGKKVERGSIFSPRPTIFFFLAK
jgi:hypothetical protein